MPGKDENVLSYAWAELRRLRSAVSDAQQQIAESRARIEESQYSIQALDASWARLFERRPER